MPVIKAKAEGVLGLGWVWAPVGLGALRDVHPQRLAIAPLLTHDFAHKQAGAAA